MNIGELFKKGYTISRIGPNRATHFLEEVKKQTFVVSQDYRDPEMSAPMITDWDAKVDGPVVKAHNAPFAFNWIWDVFGDSEWFKSSFGKFTNGSVIVNKYRPGDGMGWHYDVPDATFLQTMIYLGDSDFIETDGGGLEIGRCRVTSNGLPIKDSIIPVETVLPNHGTVVTILNTAPTLLHRVLPLNSPKSRFTIVCRYGYIGNTFTMQKWRVMKGLG